MMAQTRASEINGDVLIVDDHPIVRQGLELLNNSQPDMRVVGQATNGGEALLQHRELKPDVIVMDLKMPVINGLSAIKEIKKADPETKVLVLTSFPDDEMVISAIQLGANGVMVKDAPPEQLLGAIRDVYHGRSSLHPAVAHRLMEKIQHSGISKPLDHLLTNREIEVLKCLAHGMSNREIARKLSVQIRIVTTHVRHILDKMGLENRTQAALYAVEHGLVKKSGK